MKFMNLAKLLGVFAAALAVVAALAPIAEATPPSAGYGQFAGCPDPATEDPGVVNCIHTEITGGHFNMGNKKVPIEKTMTLTGGLHEEGEIVANSEGGLTPVKQKVPGGVVGLTGLTELFEFLGSEALTLYAVTEIAGQPVLGETLELPVRVHLINGVLGSSCYVGSFTNPIALHLTTGTTSPPPPNKPITGKTPEHSFDGATGIFHQKNGTFVDNSFSAPGASGCVLTLFGFIPVSINGLVDSASGLPAAAGTNETVQNFNTELAVPALVFHP
jgi:hypothetical protein